jgi:CheY-like chemotaxis protein
MATVETILVVDDDADIRHVISRALSGSGYRVLLAATGEQALDLLAAHDGPLHLLLTDVLMPGLSGPDLARRVRVTYPGVRVLYSSGFVGEHDFVGDDVGGAGRDAPFLKKPYSLTALRATVRAVLDA